MTKTLSTKELEIENDKKRLATLSETIKDPYELQNKDQLLDLGEKYYNDGYALEEIPESLKAYKFFVIGYNRGYRKDYIYEMQNEDNLRQLGRKYFSYGYDFLDVPKPIRKYKSFKEGYEEAKREADDKNKGSRR